MPIDPLDPPTWPGLASRRATVTPTPDHDLVLHDAPTPLLDAVTVEDLAPDVIATWSLALATTVALFLSAFAAVVSAGVLRALL